MRQTGTLILSLCLLLLLSACGNRAAPESGTEGGPAEETRETFLSITITAGDEKLEGVLYDNETARAFAQQLPLEVQLWTPAPGFARAFNLEAQLPDAQVHTRSYTLGGLAYWDPGPSIAIFYSDHLDQTIVPVTTLGQIQDDVSLFAEYDQVVRIEAAEEKEGATPSPAHGGERGESAPGTGGATASGHVERASAYIPERTGGVLFENEPHGLAAGGGGSPAHDPWFAAAFNGGWKRRA